MTNLKNNIDHYMKLKGIKMYTRLLVDIARELGKKGQEAYAFAEREKSNFTKMLNGQRPLKYDFIIPLEKIFGVSLARLMDENSAHYVADVLLVIGESDPASVSAAVAKLKAEGKTVLVQKSDAGAERCRTALKLSANGALEVI